MAIIDIIIGLPILFGIYKGYKRGVLLELIGIAAFVIAIYLSLQMLDPGSDFIEKLVGDRFSSPFLSFLIIFIPTVYIINKIGYSIKRSLRLTFLGTLDSLGGGLLGGVTWLFGMSGIIWILNKIGIVFPDEWMTGSTLYAYVQQFAPDLIKNIGKLIPNDVDWLEKFRELISIKKS